MRLFTLALLALALTATAQDQPRWWRGNLHTHSLWSDGDDYPEMIASWYKEHGYNFLGLSDHNIIADHEKWVSIAKNKGGEPAFAKYLAKFGDSWVSTREEGGDKQVRLKRLSEFRKPFEQPGSFLMIPMEEITGTVHVNATNIRETILPYTGGGKSVTSETVVNAMQYAVNAVLEQRARLGVPMFPHINHPNFKWAITAEELVQVKNDQFFEVYNGHPQVYNSGDERHAGTERVWDIVNTTRVGTLKQPPLFGLGTDDAHNYHDPAQQKSHPGRGWVMVRAATLDAPALIAAMEAGDFYASSGVTLKDVRREGKTLSVEIEPEAGVTFTTEFIGTRRGYNAGSQPVLDEKGQPLRVTRRYSPEIGAVLSSCQGLSASYTCNGDELFVRARITSSKEKADPSEPGEFERAWTQPLVP
jgi:hypothetical protein